jgi:hypothetical protein
VSASKLHGYSLPIKKQYTVIMPETNDERTDVNDNDIDLDLDEETEEVTETESDDSEETTTEEEAEESELERLKAENGRLRREAKKARRQSEPRQSQTKSPSEPVDRDEIRLVGQNYSDDEIAYAKKVASLQGVALKDAVKDPLFTTWKKQQENEVKAERAALRTSRGSTQARKTLESADLTDDEFDELATRKMNSL